MMDCQQLKQKIKQVCEENMSQFEEIGEYIFLHPENGYEEFESSKYLEDVLEQEGFQVRRGYKGLPTSFKATWGKGKTKIAFLPEYDALPGYGPNKDQMAHACGHNWISASCLGAAICLKKILSEKDATLVVIGTPAEETYGGKCVLVKEGAFDEIDYVFQMHLGTQNLLRPQTQAMDSIEFEFFGKPSHAALAPEEGINALDAVLLMFNGVNARGAHCPKSTSIAGIITKGGLACNIVPDHTACQFYIRDKNREAVDQLNKMMIEIAKGACKMTGARMEYRFFENSFDELCNDEKLVRIMENNLRDLGINQFDEKEELGGSSDIGNVSKVAKTMYFEMATGKEIFAHEEEFLDLVHGENAKKTLHDAIVAMAWSALDVIEDGKLKNKKG